MSLSRKMRIDTGAPLWLIGDTKDVKTLFDDCELKTSLTGKQAISQLVFFATDRKRLDAGFPGIAKRLKPGVLFWIAYPKKTGNISSDLYRDEGWEIVYNSDYEGVSSVAIDENWTGMRFRHRDETLGLKRELAPEERKIEGIDFIGRTVTLPGDALKQMKPHKGLAEFFYSLSFTHKKEYVEGIVGAKRQETRDRRIRTMIEAVLKLREQKQSKQKKQ